MTADEPADFVHVAPQALAQLEADSAALGRVRAELPRLLDALVGVLDVTLALRRALRPPGTT